VDDDIFKALGSVVLYARLSSNGHMLSQSQSFIYCTTVHAKHMHPFRMFYGPGGPYALFAGKDASRALAKMSFEPQDLTGDISGLGPFELDALQDWEYKFMSKYVKVGTVKKTVPVEDGNTASTAAETSETATNAPATEDKPREVAADEVKEAAADKDAKES
jgi:membrane-associated progesterone receptor component